MRERVGETRSDDDRLEPFEDRFDCQRGVQATQLKERFEHPGHGSSLFGVVTVEEIFEYILPDFFIQCFFNTIDNIMC